MRDSLYSYSVIRYVTSNKIRTVTKTTTLPIINQRPADRYLTVFARPGGDVVNLGDRAPTVHRAWLQHEAFIAQASRVAIKLPTNGVVSTGLIYNASIGSGLHG